MDAIKYPDIRRQLLALGHEDQRQVRSQYQLLATCRTSREKYWKNRELACLCHKRAERMLQLLETIHNEPTIRNIGVDGSQMVSLLALHSYVELMKKILALYERLYIMNTADIYYQAIPPLTDRIMIIDKRRQCFGTNWFTDKEGKFFLIKLENFDIMNHKRAQYGLNPCQKPHVLAFGAKEWPLGEGLATESDQKDLSDEEYAEYAQFQSSKLVKGSHEE